MDFSENENFCSVKKENDSGYYRLHTIWKSDGFILNVISKNGAWLGEMKESEMLSMASQLNFEKSAYLRHCREALTTHDGLQNIVYSIENGCFLWKKIVDEDLGIKLKMGSVVLQPVSCLDATQNMLEAVLKFNAKLLKQVNELHQKTKNDTIEKKMLLNKIDEIIKAKDDLETDLYTRFLLLLNSKKKKIEELEKKNTILMKEKNSLVEDPYEVSTDEDNNEDFISSQCQMQSNQTVRQPIEKSEIFEEKMSPKVTIPKKKIKQVEPTAETTSNNDFFLENYSSDQTNNDNIVLKESEKSIPLKKEDILEYFYGS